MRGDGVVVRWGQVIALVALVATGMSFAGPADASGPGESVAAHWTQERMDAAIPRDLVVDERGQGYLRRPGGVLQPYGGGEVRPAAKPSNPGGGGGGGGGSDTTPPSVASQDPAGGDTITTTPYLFTAVVGDTAGVKSVTFHVTGGGSTTSHTASLLEGSTSEGTWGVTIPLTDGGWSWTVEARDGAKRGGNVTTTSPVSFTVALSTSSDPEPDEVVTNRRWTAGGTVQTAAGRIYFEMPDRGPFWAGYVCSGTVATDVATDRSIIITAAHCVYDEVNDVFARNVIFIPDQDGTTGSGTDTNCDNDPLGCWAPTHGVVHEDWATGSWPSIIPHDYGYYVVPASGAHSGTDTDSPLETAAGALDVQFTETTQGSHTHALGYSYSDDPNLMFCAEALGLDADSYGSLWLGQCGLSGGASGGPWLQPVDGGNGPIVSVNSYGYSDRAGMGGPHLTGTAKCLYDLAVTGAAPPSSARGVVSSC